MIALETIVMRFSSKVIVAFADSIIRSHSTVNTLERTWHEVRLEEYHRLDFTNRAQAPTWNLWSWSRFVPSATAVWPNEKYCIGEAEKRIQGY